MEVGNLWHELSGFSDYLINEHGCIYRRSTKSTIKHNGIVALKADDGLWKNRSVKKLKKDTFETSTYGVIAKSITTDDEVSFNNIAEAADWLIQTKQAITSGRVAAHSTVRTNISHGITQPNLYPFIYGYTWKIKSERSSL